MKRALTVVAIVLGFGVQLALLNSTFYWLWVAGFFAERRSEATKNVLLFSMPCGLIFLLQTAAVWHVFVRPAIVRRARAKAGLCSRCGYDVTGNTTGRCPECGQTVERAA
jgi:uncharacterized paraquat-inducible protein A